VIAFKPVQELKVNGELHDMRAIDFDGDGTSDVIALSELERRGKSKWMVSIFHQNEEGSLPIHPDQVFELDSLVTLISPVTFPGSGTGSLLFIEPGGVYSLYPVENMRSNSIDRLINVDTPFMTNANEGPVFFDNVQDWNGDGRNDMLVFDFDGFSLLTFDANDSLVFRTHIDYQPRLYTYGGNEGSTLNDRMRLRLRYVFPVVEPGEYDGDGKVDLFITSGERLSVSTQGDGFDYSAPFTIKDFSRPAGEVAEENRRVRISLADFDGDGLTDISETRWMGTGLTETDAEIGLYKGRGRIGFKSEPDQVLRVEDALPNILIFKDLDRDGKDEMIVPTMKLGIMSYVRILTSGILHVKALIYDDDPGKVLDEEPRFVHSLTAKFDFSGTTYITSGLDDLDGDGYIDFVFGTRNNEISIFRGTGGKGNRMFSRDPVLVLSENADGRAKTEDLNGDGKKDLLLYYSSEGRIKVYFSGDSR
jgi:hypothetical protein